VRAGGADGHPGGATLGRAAAGTGAGCVALHLAGAGAGGHGAVLGTVLVAMAAACLPCLRALWRGPGAATWRATGLMYGGMLFVHLLVLSAAPGTAGHAGHGTGGGGPETVLWAGLLLATVQVALAAVGLAGARRPRPAAAQVGSPRDRSEIPAGTARATSSPVDSR
jgi:hypothetical protein